MSGIYHNKSISTRQIGLIFLLTLIAIALSACGLPTAKPEVKIISPQAGIPAGDVTIAVDISNFELLAGSGIKNESGKGHIIFYKDIPVPTYYEHSAVSKAGTYSIEHEISYTWENITPGEHTFSVQLVNNQDMPLPAAIVDSITINVGPPEGNPEIQIITPLDQSSLPPGNISIRTSVKNFIVSQEDMGVLNRKGEGHLIYYLDEAAPVIPGEPAVTDTSMVSSQLSHMWKAVKEGKHTLSVQLVNNDDTPLDSPVVKVISLDVKP
jgi:hypothetical protein